MSDTLLIVLPLPAHSVEGQIYLDDQACYGLELWLENFSRVVLACPTQGAEAPPPATRPLDTIVAATRLSFHALPNTYSPPVFCSHLPSTASLLGKLIDEAQHLHFAIGGFWGDWGAVASIVASRKKRPFAVWTDRVESNVMVFQSASKRGARRAYHLLNAWLASGLERYVIRRSAVGLFNGMDCYNAYAPFCINPQLVANFNYARGTHITDGELVSRLARLSGRSVNFVYVGRAHRDKGVFDWIEALSRVEGEFSATWFGEGPELENARQLVHRRQLDKKIAFPGTMPHDQMLRSLKRFDALVFCHKTQESPRCLVEALACGLPILGYQSDYAQQLIAEFSGGILTPVHDVDALAATLQQMVSGRDRLAALSRAAAMEGKRFNSEATFRHRSELIKLVSATPALAGAA